MTKIRFFVGLVLILYFICNIYVLINTPYVSLDNLDNTLSCENKLLSTNQRSLEKNIEILPYYTSLEDLKNVLCMGKIKQVTDSVFIYENIFVFNFIKLGYFLTSLIFFKVVKIKLKNIFILNLFFYLAYYFNFSFDFVYQTNKKLFSYELIFFEVVLLTFLSYLKLEEFFNKDIGKKFFNQLSTAVKKYYNLFIAVYVMRILYLLLRYEELKNSVFNEWFISYEYGFIKRGFIGEIARFFINNQLISYLNFMVLLVVILYVILLRLLKPYFTNLNSVLSIAILTSPIFILYNINLISTVVLPKEILGFISLLYFIKYKNSNLRYVAYLIYISAVLSHEVNFIFSIPIFFILENKNNKTNFITINLFLFILLSNFGGDIEKIQLLCANNAVYDNNCYKTLAISNSPRVHFDYSQQFINYNYVIIYLTYFLLSLSPLFLAKFNYIDLRIFGLSSLAIFSLALVTVDWGRWLFILFSILYIQLLTQNKPIIFKKITYNRIFLIAVFNMLWKVPHWGVGDNFYNNIFRIDKFSFIIIFFIIFGIYKEIKSTKESLY